MKILDDSWADLQEFVQHGDRRLVEELLDAIISVEVRRQTRQQVDAELNRRTHAPQPWLPVR